MSVLKFSVGTVEIKSEISVMFYERSGVEIPEDAIVADGVVYYSRENDVTIGQGLWFVLLAVKLYVNVRFKYAIKLIGVGGPGCYIAAVLYLLCTDRFFEVMEESVMDIQVECCDALERGVLWEAAFVYVRGLVSLVNAVSFQMLSSAKCFLMGFIVKK